MTEGIRAALDWSVSRVRTQLRAVWAYSLAFKVLSVVLLAPLTAGMLRLLLMRWGRASVGNFEIASFFLSPVGLAALLGVGSMILATLYLELAGLMRLLAQDAPAWWDVFRSSTGIFHRLVALGLRQLLAYLLLAAPFLVGIGLVYRLLWQGRDLNGLIVLKPPVFWWGIGLAGALALVNVILAARLFLRWLLAVPTLLFEPNVTVREALRRSTERTRDKLPQLATSLAIWAGVQIVLAAVVLGLLRLASGWILNRIGARLEIAVPATAMLLVVNLLVTALLSVLADVTLAGLVLAVYTRAVGGSVVREARSTAATVASRLPVGWMIAGTLLAVAALTVTIGYQLLNTLDLEDRLEITAHRAGATHAPENTVVAIRRAIADQAEWAEIDVQLTADNGLVVMHDVDLARVGGGNKRVEQATLAEIQTLDVGRLFGPEFSGERVPTLEAILAAAGDQLRLNVELKPHGPQDADALTRRVIEVLRQTGMLSRSRLCSQSYEAMQLAQQLAPDLEVGFIVAKALGDPTELNVNFLMVTLDRATRQFVDRAALREIAVHAWTVNDPTLLASLLDAGVANVITDDPALIRTRLNEIRDLSAVERLLLRARNALTQ